MATSGVDDGNALETTACELAFARVCASLSSEAACSNQHICGGGCCCGGCCCGGCVLDTVAVGTSSIKSEEAAVESVTTDVDETNSGVRTNVGSGGDADAASSNGSSW